MKKIIIVSITIIVLGVGYYLLSPFWRNVELDEASPLDSATTQSQFKDELDTMDADRRERFEQETAAMRDETKIMADAMPAKTPQIISQASFKPRAHEVSGTALLIEQNGQYTIRFENFETINGPDLKIYLSSDLGDDDYINLGNIKATKGNVNYSVPPGTDITKYRNVLVWCEAFSVLFSYAQLP